MIALYALLLLIFPGFMYGMAAKDSDKVFEIVRLYESEVTAEHINDLENALPHIADISSQRRCIRDFEYTDTFLSAAAIRNITCCRILLAHKADIDKGDQWGNTPFDVARKFFCSNTMLFLLEMGADKFSCGPKDMNFWSEAEEDNFYKILEVHRQKVAHEVQVVLKQDPAGIVSEYVVGEKLMITQ